MDSFFNIVKDVIYVSVRHSHFQFVITACVVEPIVIVSSAFKLIEPFEVINFAITFTGLADVNSDVHGSIR